MRNPAWRRTGTRASPKGLPRVAPQLATPSGEMPAGTDWVHEIAFAGRRVIAYLDARGPRLLDADGKDRSRTFSRIAAALAAIAGGRSAILDGEIAAPDADGITHRGDGARRGDRRRLAFFAFDLLWLDGKDLRQRGLLARKRALKAFLNGAKAPIFYVDHVSGDDGAELYGEVVRRGGAGILCKRKHAHYLEGRSTTWLEVRPDAVKARQMEALRQSVARERARQGR